VADFFDSYYFCPPEDVFVDNIGEVKIFKGLMSYLVEVDKKLYKI